MDFRSLEMSAGGYENILGITDHFIRYAQALPSKNRTAKTIARLLFDKRPTNLYYSRARAYCACCGCGCGCLDIFFYHLSFFFLPLWKTARYRLKFCLKGPLSPPPQKKTKKNNHLFDNFICHYGFPVRLHSDFWLVGCFGFNGPLRKYFSLYRAVSQREGERGEKG